MDVEPYVGCSLWVQRPGEEALCVVPGGKLSLDRLAQQPMDEAGAVHFLKFTDTEDLRSELVADACNCSADARRTARSRLEPSGRAGPARPRRVLLPLRRRPLLDRAPGPRKGAGESAAAASVAYERIMAEKNDTATTGVCFARTVGSSSSTGCSTRSTTGGAGSSARTTTRRTGRRSWSTSRNLSPAGCALSGWLRGPQLHGGQPPSPLGRPGGRKVGSTP